MADRPAWVVEAFAAIDQHEREALAHVDHWRREVIPRSTAAPTVIMPAVPEVTMTMAALTALRDAPTVYLRAVPPPEGVGGRG